MGFLHYSLCISSHFHGKIPFLPSESARRKPISKRRKGNPDGHEGSRDPERVRQARRAVPAPPVHGHPRDHQERRGPAVAVREGARRRDPVRRLFDRGLHADRGIGHGPRARPRHVPHLPVVAPEREGRPPRLRHHRAGRQAVRGLPAPDAEAPDGQGEGSRLHAHDRARGGVLPLPPRRERRPDRRHARPGRLLRPDARGPRRRGAARHRRRARGDGLRGRGGAPRSRSRPARDRLQVRRRGHDGRPGHDVQAHREEGRARPRPPRDVHAEADFRRERLRHARATSRSSRAPARP